MAHLRTHMQPSWPISGTNRTRATKPERGCTRGGAHIPGTCRLPSSTLDAVKPQSALAGLPTVDELHRGDDPRIEPRDRTVCGRRDDRVELPRLIGRKSGEHVIDRLV